MTLAVEPAKANRRKTRKADREGTMFLADGRYMFVRGSEGQVCMGPSEWPRSKMSIQRCSLSIRAILVDARLANSIALVVVVAGLKAKLLKFTFFASGDLSDYVIQPLRS